MAEVLLQDYVGTARRSPGPHGDAPTDCDTVPASGSQRLGSLKSLVHALMDATQRVLDASPRAV